MVSSAAYVQAPRKNVYYSRQTIMENHNMGKLLTLARWRCIQSEYFLVINSASLTLTQQPNTTTTRMMMTKMTKMSTMQMTVSTITSGSRLEFFQQFDMVLCRAIRSLLTVC